MVASVRKSDYMCWTPEHKAKLKEKETKNTQADIGKIFDPGKSAYDNFDWNTIDQFAKPVASSVTAPSTPSQTTPTVSTETVAVQPTENKSSAGSYTSTPFGGLTLKRGTKAGADAYEKYYNS